MTDEQCSSISKNNPFLRPKQNSARNNSKNVSRATEAILRALRPDHPAGKLNAQKQ
jgi:hypothetical protein